jgi:hypothetical protein
VGSDKHRFRVKSLGLTRWASQKASELRTEESWASNRLTRGAGRMAEESFLARARSLRQGEAA